MRKDFFEEHFHGRSFSNSLNYYLSAWLFQRLPHPQREPGALDTLRYMGEIVERKKVCTHLSRRQNDRAMARSHRS